MVVTSSVTSTMTFRSDVPGQDRHTRLKHWVVNLMQFSLKAFMTNELISNEDNILCDVVALRLRRPTMIPRCLQRGITVPLDAIGLAVQSRRVK